ncbi:hypothetical protein [Nocardia cyriacigeorgica]|uniref:hypothetical protein n=1 Tax=Nocardia cyriacigeorgica TaxID=135487 RepID=UPI0024537FD1|nr:hypothetical protein [Nocardia cyriacigeorgica]
MVPAAALAKATVAGGPHGRAPGGSAMGVGRAEVVEVLAEPVAPPVRARPGGCGAAGGWGGGGWG